MLQKKTKFLEPAVGSGSFYFSILDNLVQHGFDAHYAIENMLYAYDVDENALELLLLKLKEKYHYSGKRHKIIEGDFLTKKIEKISFDYIVTNPPYISSKNIQPSNGNKKSYINKIKKVSQIEFDYRSDIYMMFFLKTLNLLSETGKQIFLCSDSWLDCEYGWALKEKITTSYQLEVIANSQLFPFFRDDTSAVITVISKVKDKSPCKTRVITIKSSLEKIKSIADLKYIEFSQEELAGLFSNHFLINNRNVLVLHGENYFKNKKAIQKYSHYFTQVGRLIHVASTGISQSIMQKGDYLQLNDGRGTPLFWQIQARVNRPPNYKNHIGTHELEFKVNELNLEKNMLGNIKENSVYMSGIIDRFPLVFYTEGKTFHVSKYLHLDSNVLSPIEICMTMNNIFTMYCMELDLKEGTRKTLRVGEMGLTKEISKTDLSKIECIDFTKFSQSSRECIKRHAESYENRVIYNIEEAVRDKDYLAIQLVIKDELGMNDIDFQYIKNELLNMYYFRMRNLGKLGLCKNIGKPGLA